MKEKELHLERYIDALSNELLDLNTICHILRFLYNKKDILNEYNIAPCFFGTIESAIFTKFILWTYKLFDTEHYKKERCLFGLLNFCETNLKLFEKENLIERCKGREISLDDRKNLSHKEIDDFKNELLQLKIMKSIKIRRDKYHGHFDKNYFFLDKRSMIDDEAPLLWNEIEVMLDLSERIINTITHKYKAESKIFKFMNVNDVEVVFDILKEHNEKLKQEAIDAGVYTIDR